MGGWLLASGNALAVDASAMDGRAIIDLMTERREQAHEFEIQNMTLIDQAGNKEERELRRYVRKDEDGEFKYLVVFHSPSGVKGVAVLTWQHKEKADEQWLYLPAYKKKMKRIAKGDRKKLLHGHGLYVRGPCIGVRRSIRL